MSRSSSTLNRPTWILAARSGNSFMQKIAMERGNQAEVQSELAGR